MTVLVIVGDSFEEWVPSCAPRDEMLDTMGLVLMVAQKHGAKAIRANVSPREMAILLWVDASAEQCTAIHRDMREHLPIVVMLVVSQMVGEAELRELQP